MFGSEPYLRDSGLIPSGVVGDRDASLHLYRRNSCQQERLNHDLQRLRQQEERILRKTTREIIDLTLEQKQRKEILKRPRRQSECLGLHRPLPFDDDHHSKGEHLLARRQLASRSSPNIASSSTGVKRNARRRASVSATTLPDLSGSPGHSRLTDRPKSQSSERLSPTAVSESSSSVHESFVDFKSQKEVSRLKKFSERWRNLANPNSEPERTGRPLIPTNSFSTNTDKKTPKKSQVFDRLSHETRTFNMPSDQFLRVLRNKSKSHDSNNT